ncbi:MAG: hypothetical protein AABX11_00565 [Nanoarchaeota archaeon]
MAEINERQVIELIAKDRLSIPLSSMYQKVSKRKKKDAEGLAQVLGVKNRFETDRVYAYAEDEDKMKARRMKEAIAEFQTRYPEAGANLNSIIEEQRMTAERHLYFGVREGSRLTTDDYIGVMRTLGLSEQVARNLYPDLINVSRKLANAREESRSILVGGSDED